MRWRHTATASFALQAQVIQGRGGGFEDRQLVSFKCRYLVNGNRKQPISLHAHSCAIQLSRRSVHPPRSTAAPDGQSQAVAWDAGNERERLCGVAGRLAAGVHQRQQLQQDGRAVGLQQLVL